MEFSLRSISKVLFEEPVEHIAADLQRAHETLSDKFNNISRRMLPNGLRVNSRPDSTSPVVRMKIRVNAGGLNDPPGKEGVAHMVEHMAFVRNDLVAGMVKDFKARGGSLNAVTDPDTTEYEFSIPAGRANEKLLYALAGRMLTPAGFDARQLQEEKEVVLSEAAEGADHRDQDISQNIYAQAAGKKSVSDDVIGTPESIVGLTVDDLHQFQRNCYGTENITIELTGAQSALVSPFHEIKKNFGALAAGQAVSPPAPEVAYQGGFRHMAGPARMTYTGVALPCGDDDGIAPTVLSEYIGISLRDKLRGDQDRTSYSPLASMNAGYKNQKLLVMTANAPPHKAQRLLPAIAGILSELASGKIDESRLKTVLARMKSEKQQFDATTLNDKNDLINPVWSRQYSRKNQRALAAVKPEDLTGLTRTMLAAGPPTLVTRGNVENMQSYDDFLKMLPAVPPPSAPSVSRAATALPAT